MPGLFKYDAERLGNYISQLLQDPGMRVIRVCRLVAVNLHQEVPNLLFA